MSIKAVVFDLDDTLFPELDYVKSGYKAVAEKIEKTYGIQDAYTELFELFEKDRKNVFDRFLKNHALTDDETSVGELVNIYRTHTPNITLSDEVKQTLIKLRTSGYRLGIITDGRPEGQRSKITALELNGLVDKIIITDELGGERYRKPNPTAFEQMAQAFNINLDEMMYVGDNPQKDFAIKKYAPVKTARICNDGLYLNYDYMDGIAADTELSEISEICEMLNGRQDIVIIANFVDNFEYKGNSRFAYIADLLSENNDVELVTSDFCHVTKSKKPMPNKLNYKVTFLSECGYPKNVCLKRFKSHKQFGKNVKKYLSARKKPDCIYCAVPSLECAKYAAEYANKNKVKFIVDVQDLWPEAFQMVFNVPVLSKLIFSPMKRKADYIYSSADAIVGVSETYCRRAASVNKKVSASHSVYLGIDLSMFDANVVENKVEIAPDKFVIGYCGTLGSSYDIKCVIDAIAKANVKAEKPIEFRIFGDGPLGEEFKRYAADRKVNAVFYGRLKYEKMCGELVACDIAVNPIKCGAAQSIINKHGDYAAAGKAIISTQESPEYKRLIDDYKCGINCKCGNSDELAEAILLLQSNDAMRNEMGENSRRLAEERFDRQNIYKEITGLLETRGKND